MQPHPLLELVGRRVSLPKHFDGEVTLEEARPLGANGSGGYECRVRLADGTLEETILSPDEANAVAGSGQPPAAKVKVADPARLHLLIESNRIRLAYTHDRQFAVSLSGIRTLPHQIEAVYEKMLPQPRLRFLLADDPGAGKTIMAGLLIKELRLREAVERVLILCPAPLTIQWQDELQRWFGEAFDIIFSAVDQQQLTNPWQRSNCVIASLDYAKQDDVRERIWQQHWDLVIIDEAHKCSAYTKAQFGRSDEVTETKRYQLAKKLTAEADHVLLLTATPHHGDEDRFAHFLRLLDPDLFPEPHRLGKTAEQLRKDVFRLGENCPWALRRLKEDLRDLQGRRLFPNRHATTVPFCLNSDEYHLYKAVTEYINRFLPNQAGRRKASAALARTVLQRRLTSSTCAIHESLKRRWEKQRTLLEDLEGLPPAQRAKRLAALQGRLTDTEQDDDDLDEDASDHLSDEFTAATEMDQLRAEVAALVDLVEQARKVRELATDSKLATLRECLKRAQFGELRDGRGKLLVFTEHRDTLNYLKGHLQKWGYSTCEIHGGMNPHERRKAQELFRTQAQVCIATEAAGEGINLQFCHLMVNYDMPWNPTRLEQRLGRIHRIGQKQDAYVFNFVATESESGQPIIEGRILQRLLEKLDEMREALEGRVFDVIGEVLSLNDINLPEMLREAAHDPRRLEEYISQLDRLDPDKLRKYEEATGIALARAHVDFSAVQMRNLEVEEKRLMPHYVERFFLNAAREAGLRVESRADGLFRVDYVPADLRSDRLTAVRKLGRPETAYRKITFHKTHLDEAQHADAVLMGPGHPLYAAVEEKLREKLAGVIGGTAVFVDPLASAPYKIHFFEIAIRGKDSRGNDVSLFGELVAVRHENGHCELTTPAALDCGLVPAQQQADSVPTFDIQPAADFLKSSYQLECRNRCQKEREHFAGIVREYLEKSFTERINRAQERAMNLQAEAVDKSDFKLAADEATRLVSELERTREERRAGLKRLELARTGPVQHIATALVLAANAETSDQLAALSDEPDPETRRKIELAAEEIVIADLVAEGFPRDRIERIGHLKVGFDIRAHRVRDPKTGEIEVRRVEVKGRMRNKPVRLTDHEWREAHLLRETYWLYVVWDPLAGKDKPLKVQDPVGKLDYAKKEIIAARYFELPADAIVGAAEGKG